MAPDDQTPDVLTSLPKTRPQRRSAKRDATRSAAAAPAAKAKAKAEAKAPAAAGAKRAAAKPAREKPAGDGAALPPSGFAPPRRDEPISPSGAELIGTAVQAAGELAQMGAAVGKHALRSALGRLGGR